MSAAEGAEFDRQYIETQLQLHQEAVSFYETAQVEAENPRLAEYFEDTLPTLRDHLEDAQEMATR